MNSRLLGQVLLRPLAVYSQTGEMPTKLEGCGVLFSHENQSRQILLEKTRPLGREICLRLPSSHDRPSLGSEEKRSL